MVYKNPFVILSVILLDLALLGGMCMALARLSPGGSLTRGTITASETGVATIPSQMQTMPPTRTFTPRAMATLSSTPVVALTGTALIAPTLAPSQILTGTTTLIPTFTPYPSATMGPLGVDSWCVPWNTEAIQTRVDRVIDGVTIEVHIDGELYQVRYIGIATPEIEWEPNAGAKATEKNRELVEGEIVLLVRDRSEADVEGRLLRYVIAGAVFVNRALVESGYAIAQSALPDVSCEAAFEEAEALARSSNRGLWSPTPTPTRTAYPPTPTLGTTGEIKITFVYFQGTPWEEWDEFVEIRSTSAWPIQMQGWWLKDNQNHTFFFPSLILYPGDFCRIYTNNYQVGLCNFSYWSLSPIWDNDGDCAYLYDGQGKLVDQFCYE